MTSRRATPELDALVDLFYAERAALGEFQEVAEAQLPAVAQRLLAHDQHMTVTVEDFHACPVSVEVLQTNITATHYSRKIVLRRQTDDAIVLFGLVRLNLSVLSPDVRAEIESQLTPLGHILIAHNVLRTVRLLSLWQVAPAEELRGLLALAPSTFCYGRTALIYCDGVPAVELLEIVPG
jgi:chorismate-pyruvate lyase